VHSLGDCIESGVRGDILLVGSDDDGEAFPVTMLLMRTTMKRTNV
jgi:hypothetical protein